MSGPELFLFYVEEFCEIVFADIEVQRDLGPDVQTGFGKELREVVEVEPATGELTMLDLLPLTTLDFGVEVVVVVASHLSLVLRSRSNFFFLLSEVQSFSSV